MVSIRWGSETQLTDITWLWKPLIPFGKVTIIEGDGGDGKTTLILTLAAMLSRGTPPPTLKDGHLVPANEIDPLTTFYLTNEDEIADSSLKRFLRAGGDDARFAYSGETEHHVTLQETDLRQIIEGTGAHLLIIDPLQAFLPKGTSLGSVTAMRDVFTMLSKVARSTGAAIVLITHLNKNESSKDIYRGYGSADIAASVRSILLVEKDAHGHRFIRAIKSNFDESDYTPIELVFDEDRRLTFQACERNHPPVSEEPAPYDPFDDPFISKTTFAEYLIRTRLQQGPCPISEIHSYTDVQNISRKTVQRAAHNVGAEQIYIKGIPCWQLPEKKLPSAG